MIVIFKGKDDTGQLDKFFIYRFLKEKAFKRMMHIPDPTPAPKLQKFRIENPNLS